MTNKKENTLITFSSKKFSGKENFRKFTKKKNYK